MGVVAEARIQQAGVDTERCSGLEVVLDGLGSDLLAAEVVARGNIESKGGQEALPVGDRQVS